MIIFLKKCGLVYSKSIKNAGRIPILLEETITFTAYTYCSNILFHVVHVANNTCYIQHFFVESPIYQRPYNLQETQSAKDITLTIYNLQ